MLLDSFPRLSLNPMSKTFLFSLPFSARKLASLSRLLLEFVSGSMDFGSKRILDCE